MNRSDLADRLAQRFGNLTKDDTDLSVGTILEALKNALVVGRRVEIRHFGTFSSSRRPPRLGRNPRNGDSVAVTEKRVVHFKAGKTLRESVDRWAEGSKTGEA